MSVDAYGGVWLDNPLLVLGLVSLLWVVIAALHDEPWRRRPVPQPDLEALLALVAEVKPLLARVQPTALEARRGLLRPRRAARVQVRRLVEPAAG
jgi:hypothetical protein